MKLSVFGIWDSVDEMSVSVVDVVDDAVGGSQLSTPIDSPAIAIEIGGVELKEVTIQPLSDIVTVCC